MSLGVRQFYVKLGGGSGEEAVEEMGHGQSLRR